MVFCHQLQKAREILVNYYETFSITKPFSFRNEFYKIWLSCVHFTIDLQNYLQLFDFYLLRITSFYLLKLYIKKFPQLS